MSRLWGEGFVKYPPRGLMNCPYNECPFKSADEDDIDDHVLAAHREDPLDYSGLSDDEDAKDPAYTWDLPE